MAQSPVAPFGLKLVTSFYFFLFAVFVFLSFFLFLIADSVSLGQSAIGGVMAAENPLGDKLYYLVNGSDSQSDISGVLKDDLSGDIKSLGRDALKSAGEDLGRELVVAPAVSYLNSLSSVALGFVGVLSLLFGLLNFLLGFGLVSGWGWSRILVIIFSVIIILIEIPLFIVGMRWSGSFIIIVNALIAGYLIFSGGVKEWFE
ncbi:DUF2127 domain-containing protein [Candidatus Woesearchaeota archaeon]|nr:DUF2127 domain-containing protein [Candidatus Woesearchaeota archaeon]